jgi:hypothetical protein
MRAMPVQWETSYESAVTQARDTKRLIMAEVFSPY